MGFLMKAARRVGRRERVLQTERKPLSGGEAGLETDKAGNCEPVHAGAWETGQHRGAAVTRLAQAALAVHIPASSMIKHLGHLLSAALFLEIYDVYQIWQLAHL